MAEYKDISNIEIPKGFFDDLNVPKLLAWLKSLPTADVVPKSEVERLQEALSKAEADVKNYIKVAEYQQSLSVKRYHEIKRLKEDIERLEDINERDVENLRLAKAEVAREIFEEIETLLALNSLQGDVFTGKYFDADLENDIAEFKKKYTEA